MERIDIISPDNHTALSRDSSITYHGFKITSENLNQNWNLKLAKKTKRNKFYIKHGKKERVFGVYSLAIFIFYTHPFIDKSLLNKELFYFS